MWKRLLLVVCTLLALGAREAAALDPVSRQLAAAAGRGDREAVAAALQHGVSVDAADKTGKTLLMSAAEQGQDELVAYLLFSRAQVDRRDRKGKSALMYACENGQQSVANILIQAGADVNAADRHGMTVVEYAENSREGKLVSLLVACGAKPAATKGAAKEEAGYHKISVNYATNRKSERDPATNATTGYSNQPDDRIHYGSCDVSIPKNHLPGEMESPLPFFSWDPSRHVTLLGITAEEREACLQEVRERLKASGSNDVLIFIHGYNVSFADAARRTAQLSYDLRFPGAAMFFSWPSTSSLLGYGDDQKRIKATIPFLKEYLRTVATSFKDANINIIAHSMGTFGFTTALKELVEEMAANNERPRFKEIILAAPDIDANQFREVIAPKITPTAQRVTLYASSRDLALIISKFVNRGQRAGDSDPEIFLGSGVESIDVSRIDTSLLGHSYYGDSTSVITDISSVIGSHLKPEKRPFLEEMRPSKEKSKYWLFNPLKVLEKAPRTAAAGPY